MNEKTSQPVIVLKNLLDNLIASKKELDHIKIESNKGKIDGNTANFNKDQHDAETRKNLSTSFLSFFFGSLLIFFILCLLYNGAISIWGCNKEIKLLDIPNILSLLATTFGSGLGFIFGYYFKGNNN